MTGRAGIGGAARTSARNHAAKREVEMDEQVNKLTTPESVAECDSFRDLARVFTVDPRYKSRAVLDPNTGVRPMTIDDHWRDIDALVLHDGVPRLIRVHFDTARNLLLYSWFA